MEETKLNLHQFQLYFMMGQKIGQQKRNFKRKQKNYEKKVISKVTLGATKSFDYGDFKDRISLTGELYYNGKGYNKNIIKEFLNSDNRVEFAANYYEPNDYGMYYAAFFMQFDKFLNDSNKSIKFNAISNISDKSGIATAGFVYKPIDDFTIETDLNGYFGEEYSEYMLKGDSSNIKPSEI